MPILCRNCTALLVDDEDAVCTDCADDMAEAQ